jgi:hypothetical protein
MPVKLVIQIGIAALALSFATSCASKHRVASRPISHPDAAGGGWQDLHPGMDLRVENAYYKDGVPRHGLVGYLGTEAAVYRVRPKKGLRLVSAKTHLPRRPDDQPPAQDLIRPSQRRHSRYRFFYAVVFDAKADIHGSVLLGADSAEEIDGLTRQLLADPNSVCGDRSRHCSVFPDTCTVSLQMEVVVNGVPRAVIWGSLLASVVRNPRQVELSRSSAAGLTHVKIDPADPKALRTPLLPGDRIEWD